MAFWSLLVEHWQLKLLSVVFAVALWVFVASEDKSGAVYTVPVELTERPAGVEVTSVGAETVVVHVEGLRSVLTRLREEDLRAEVSLRGAQPGKFVARILPKNVTVPRGVKVVRVTPSQVRATLEAVTRARVEVAPRLSGRPAPGYQVARVQVEPRQIEVRVAPAEVPRIREVATMPLDIEGAQGTVSQEVGLVVPAGVALGDAAGRVVVTVQIVRQP